VSRAHQRSDGAVCSATSSSVYSGNVSVSMDAGCEVEKRRTMARILSRLARPPSSPPTRTHSCWLLHARGSLVRQSTRPDLFSENCLSQPVTAAENIERQHMMDRSPAIRSCPPLPPGGGLAWQSSAARAARTHPASERLLAIGVRVLDRMQVESHLFTTSSSSRHAWARLAYINDM
jgi:hypothetical protein